MNICSDVVIVAAVTFLGEKKKNIFYRNDIPHTIHDSKIFQNTVLTEIVTNSFVSDVTPF